MLIQSSSDVSLFQAGNREGTPSHIRVYGRTGDPRKRAFREHEVLRRLGLLSPRILTTDVTGHGEVYTVLEYLGSQPVASLLSRGLSGPDMAIALGSALAETLSEPHAQGWSNCTLTLETAHVHVDGAMLIADWAAASGPGMPVSDLEALLGRIPTGTSPELRRGYESSPASDIYACMLIVLSVLTGQDVRLLEPAELPAAVRAALANEPPEWVREFNQLAAASLSANPAQRIQNATEWLDRLVPLIRYDENPLLAFAETHVSVLDMGATRAWQSVAALQQVFENVERVIYVVRRQGWNHPASAEAIETFCTMLISIVRNDPDGISFDVAPWELRSRKRSIWTPAAPLDRIPYQLFASGFRTITVLPGVELDECRRFVHWLLLNPANDLSEEDDMATAWWHHAFEHVEASLVSSVVLSDLEEYEELEVELNRLRSSDVHRAGTRLRARLGGHGSTAAAVDAGLGADLAPSPSDSLILLLRQAWPVTLSDDRSARIASVVLDVWEDARERGDAPVVGGAFRAWSEETIRDGYVRTFLEVWANMQQVLNEPDRRTLVAVTESPELMDLVLTWVSHETEESDHALNLLALVLQELGSRPAARIAAWIARSEDPAQADAVLPYLIRHAPALLSELTELLPAASEVGAAVLLELAASERGGLADVVIAAGGASEHLNIRLEAFRLLLLRNSELGAPNGMRLIDTSRELRRETLSLASEVYSTNPQADPSLFADALSQRANRRDFHTWPLADRHALFTCVWRIDADAGERIAIEILDADRLIAESDHEATRRLCAELLAELGGEPARQALRKQARRLVTSSHELQKTAREALQRIELRLDRGHS
jgi:hypothetical protein